MDITRAKTIHLDRKESGVTFEPDEWSRAGHWLMRHEPTQTTFLVAPDTAALKRGAIGIFDVSARLVHVCDGHAVPSVLEEVELGKAAIAVYLQEINVWKPTLKHVHPPSNLVQ
jgi:hypothetical protein